MLEEAWYALNLSFQLLCNNQTLVSRPVNRTNWVRWWLPGPTTKHGQLSTTSQCPLSVAKSWCKRTCRAAYLTSIEQRLFVATPQKHYCCWNFIWQATNTTSHSTTTLEREREQLYVIFVRCWKATTHPISPPLFHKSLPPGYTCVSRSKWREPATTLPLAYLGDTRLCSVPCVCLSRSLGASSKTDCNISCQSCCC